MKQKNTLLRRILLCTAAAAMACVCFGCSDSSETWVSTEENIAMEDLEYGATMRDDDSYAVPLEYDKRYFEAGELEALANYYAAIQNQDTALFSSCVLREYMESLYQNAYGGLLDDSAYLAQQQQAFQEKIDGDFTFAKISVSDCKEQDETGSGAEYLIQMLNELNSDDSYCDTHLKSCKSLTVQPILSNGTDTALCDEVTVFVLNMDGTYYVCA